MRELILAIETSTRFSNVALTDAGGDPVAQRATTPEEGRPLAELVRDCVDGRWDDVGAYAVGIGPGSFTGLRVGLAFLKGVAAARPRPVVPISSLAAWAQSVDDIEASGSAGSRWVVLDARRSRVWAGQYRVEDDGLVAALRDDFTAPLSDVQAAVLAAPGVVVGTAAAEVKAHAMTALDAAEGRRSPIEASRSEAVDAPPSIGSTPDPALAVPRPSAVHLARLARRAWGMGRARSIRDVAPNYLMASAAEEKANPPTRR